jgi:hypothetical protein
VGVATRPTASTFFSAFVKLLMCDFYNNIVIRNVRFIPVLDLTFWEKYDLIILLEKQKKGSK